MLHLLKYILTIFQLSHCCFPEIVCLQQQIEKDSCVVF